MKVDTERLITVANFAKMKGVTTTTVYGWIASGKERQVKIDGITFVLMEIEDSKNYKGEDNETGIK